MGCPAPKVAGNGGGSALMKNVPQAAEIVKAVVDAVDVPVTVKMRTGWDKNSLNAVELALACEAAGASAITVHGRTRDQMYAPPVDFQSIKAVKNAVKIPVIANGDIVDGKSAKAMYEITGCDFIMVGRGAMGNPFVFEEINAYLQGIPYEKPNLEKRLEACIEQINLMLKYKDPHNAILESRKHTAWYMSGLNGAAALRRECGQISSMQDVLRICEKALEQNKDL
jgi:nifR3 family TIM-barrel protein